MKIAVASLAIDEKSYLMLHIFMHEFMSPCADSSSMGAKKEEAESLLHCNDCLSLLTQLQSFPVNVNK